MKHLSRRVRDESFEKSEIESEFHVEATPIPPALASAMSSAKVALTRRISYGAGAGAS